MIQDPLVQALQKATRGGRRREIRWYVQPGDLERLDALQAAYEPVRHKLYAPERTRITTEIQRLVRRMQTPPAPAAAPSPTRTPTADAGVGGEARRVGRRLGRRQGWARRALAALLAASDPVLDEVLKARRGLG